MPQNHRQRLLQPNDDLVGVLCGDLDPNQGKLEKNLRIEDVKPEALAQRNASESIGNALKKDSACIVLESFF